MGLPTADDMVDCALLVSKLDCQARLLVRIQLSLIAISRSPGREVKCFLCCQMPGCDEAFSRAGGEGRGGERRSREESPGRPLCRMLIN